MRLPGCDVKVDGHAVHVLAPVWFEYVPAGHETQVVELLAPDTDEYAPAGQLTHALAPASEYVPARQLTHALAPASEYVPAGHVWQVDAAVAPVEAEYVPAPQLLQAAEPSVFLKVPVMHSAQCISGWYP